MDGQNKLPGGVTGKGFRPGVSGNPAGRPRSSLRAILREMLDATEIPDARGGVVELPEGFTFGHLVVQGLLKAAAKGNVKAAVAVFKLIGPEDDATSADCREALLSRAENAVREKTERNPDGR